MVTTIVPREVSEGLARAKAYLKRDECPRSLDAAAAALKIYARTKIVGNAKYLAEVSFHEYVTEAARHRIIRDFFLSQGVKKEPFIVYKPSQEAELAGALIGLGDALEKLEQSAKQAEQEEIHKERSELLKKGLNLLYTKGEEAKGRAVLRRYIDNYGEEDGVIREIANHFLKANLPLEAVELYEQAILEFPKDSKAYVGAIDAYSAVGDKEKVEDIYMQIIKEFGGHPKTYLNMSKFYLSWHKKDKAYEYALRTLQGDKSLTEAQEIIDKIDKRL